MYRDVLGYEVDTIANEYYADKENAYDMKLYFDKSVKGMISKEKNKKTGDDAAEQAKAANTAAGSTNFAGEEDN